MFTVPNKKLLVTGGKIKATINAALELRIIDNLSASVTLVIDRSDALDLEEPVRIPLGEVATRIITCPLDLFSDVLQINPKDDVKIIRGVEQKEVDCYVEIACSRMLELVHVKLGLDNAGTGVYIDEVLITFKKSSISLRAPLFSDDPQQESINRYFRRR